MDNEKAIEVLTELLESINPNDLGKEHIMNYAQALSLAIEALEHNNTKGEAEKEETEDAFWRRIIKTESEGGE